MRKIFFIFAIFLTSIQAKSQDLEFMLQDTMTIAQAKKALEYEMGKISAYFFHDYYGRYLNDRFEYSKEFRYEIDPLEILSRDSITSLIANHHWKLRLRQTNRGDKGRIDIDHNLDGRMFIKKRVTVPIYFDQKYEVTKVFYSNSEETNPEVLKTDSWFQNRKFIDSLVLNISVAYPTTLKTIATRLDTANKVTNSDGAYIQVLKTGREGFLDIMVPDLIDDNLAFIGLKTTDGTLYQSTYDTYTPKEPSTPMRSYANDCFMLYKRLVENIDNNKYKNIKELMVDLDQARPIAPVSKWIYRYGFEEKANMDSIVFSYFSDYDTVTVKNLYAANSFPRKGNYVVVEAEAPKKIIRGIADENGNWIIKPHENTLIIDEVAGIFYKINSRVNTETNKLVFVDEKRKEFVVPDFDVVENIDNSLLIIVQNDLYGLIDRNGKKVLPTKFAELSYNKRLGLFIAKIKDDNPSYQLFNKQGKPLSKKTFNEVNIYNNTLYTKEVKRNKKIITEYDKDLKPINKKTDQ